MTFRPNQSLTAEKRFLHKPVLRRLNTGLIVRFLFGGKDLIPRALGETGFENGAGAERYSARLGRFSGYGRPGR